MSEIVKVKIFIVNLYTLVCYTCKRFWFHFPNIKIKHFSALFSLINSTLSLPPKKNSSFLKKPLSPTKIFFNDYIKNKQQHFSRNILFSIIVPIYKTKLEYLHEMIDSIENQSYKNWELILVDDFSDQIELYREIKKRVLKNSKIKLIRLPNKTSIGNCTNFGIKKSSGEYIGLLDHDDFLEPHTLFLAAFEINKNSNIAFIYTDEDKYNGANFYDFRYKQDFDRILLLSSNYINHFKIFKKSTLKKVGFFNSNLTGVQDYEFLTRFINNISDNQICHIPVICYHWRSHSQSTASGSQQKPYMLDQAKAIFQNNLLNLNLSAEVVYPEYAKTHNLIYFNLQWNKPSPPVSFIIPNKDSYKLLKKCIDSLCRTVNKIKKHEFIIVDDNSYDSETLDYYDLLINEKKINCQILKVNYGEFNFSKMINHGVQNAKNEYLLILNNDVSAISIGWLDQMTGWFEMKNIGIVGPKLLFPNNNVQHAGVIVGSHHGLADHYFYNIENSANSYLNLHNLQRNVSAVTGACFLTRKKIFMKAGGMDELSFKVSYSDIDFCLKVKNMKYSIIYDSKIELYHLTSASRGKYVNPNEHHNFIRKYKDFVDPYVNPNLDINNPLIPIIFDKFSYSKYIDQSLHLAFFTHNLDIGGAPLLVYDYVKKLSKVNFSITVISAKNGALFKMFSTLKNVRVFVVEINVSSNTQDLAGEVKKYFHELDKILKNNLPNLIYANTLISYPAVLYANFYQIPSRWLIHEEYNSSELYFNFTGSQGVDLIKQAFNFATKVVYESSHILNMYKRYREKNVELRAGGIDYVEVEKYQQNKNKINLRKIRKKFNIPKDHKIFLNVGTVCERKNQHEIVEAVSKLSKDVRSTFSVFLIGDIGLNYSEKIKKIISKNNLKNIFLLQNHNNIYDFYLMADFYISSTKSESFPRSILTAMAFNIPIISSIYPGVHEMLFDENYAIFYKLGNITDLSIKIKSFLKSDANIKHKAGLALSLIMRRFNLDEVILYESEAIKKMVYL